MKNLTLLHNTYIIWNKGLKRKCREEKASPFRGIIFNPSNTLRIFNSTIKTTVCQRSRRQVIPYHVLRVSSRWQPLLRVVYRPLAILSVPLKGRLGIDTAKHPLKPSKSYPLTRINLIFLALIRFTIHSKTNVKRRWN